MNLDIRRTHLVADTVGIEVVARNTFAEALLILGEGVATARDIDRIMRDAIGLPLGPFELYLDRVNLDVLPSMQSLLDYRYDGQRETPPALSAPAYLELAAGQSKLAANEALPGNARPARVWVSQAVPEWAEAVRALVAAAGVAVDLGQRPARDALIVVMPMGQDASSLCATQGLDARRTVAIDCLFGLGQRRTLMSTPLTTDDMLEAARGLFGADGTPVTTIRDSAGLVAQRLVAVMVNTACDIAQQRGLAAGDVDCAVRLQLGYPFGALALGDRIGARRVLALLEAMQDFSGDPRYRPSPWLKRRALLGVSLLGGN